MTSTVSDPAGSLVAVDSEFADGKASRRVSAPVIAVLVMVVLTFLHRGLQDVLPNKTFAVLVVVAVVTAAVWMDRTPTRLRGIGPVEWAMVAYLGWNVCSMFAPHRYDAANPLTGVTHSVAQFIMVSAGIPLVMYVVGRYTFDRTAAVRLLLWTILLLAAYSAAMSILPFTGPKSWVWPRFIVDGSLVPGVNTWAGRAIGVFNQPVVNGMILVLGFAVAMLLISRRDEPGWRRFVALAIALACGVGIYLTYTRAVWMSAALVLIIGALFAKGYRRGFVVTLSMVAIVIAANWARFTSSDRAAGGVGSEGEVEDRLNVIRTALWAAAHKPLTGWGILRFEAVNTFHHQQWSPETPWIRGYGIVSHQNELGILAELGVIGLGCWLAIVVLIAYKLLQAYRSLPDFELCGKPLALTAIIAVVVLFGSGLTVDLRLFDFPATLIYLLVGVAVGWSDRHRAQSHV
ncbi:O-antigen ligase family protein [Mycolicibacterium moriokaense]|nr:O-antigen ligase family protein [Mycolicibacterium moriokaense]